MRVLLVEDDAELCARLKADLGRAGYAADTADNGIDAQCLGEQEPYDAVILDLGLPGRSGLEVLKNWRTAGSKVPVLVLTARDAWYEKVDGFKAGADD
jgi:two-component system OmpR family response regulator